MSQDVAPNRQDEIPTVGWVSDPNGRGTLGLIISCLLTLGFCVWSAMHLNIPVKKETQLQYWLRSLKWVALGVLIPELVILAAWRQWLSARKMGKEIEVILDEEASKGGHSPRRYKWTNVHSFYAGMGGFVFDVDFFPSDSKEMLPRHSRLTLTASGVILLAKCGHLPDIDRDFLWDKSKADGLAKAIVCLQAAWMILQTGGRLIVRQPVTLLEVNTIAHIFCAFVIYALWWSKPRDVHEPVVLQGEWVRPICAYMYMSSRVSGQKLKGLITLSSWIKPELDEFAWYPDPGSELTSELVLEPIRLDSDSQEGQDTNFIELQYRSVTSPVSTRSSNMSTNEAKTVVNGALKKRPEHTLTGLPDVVIKPTVEVDNSDTFEKQRNRIVACEEAVRTYPAIYALFSPPNKPSIYNIGSTVWLKPETPHLVTDTATNWPSDYYLPGISGELMGIALWLSSTLYGGIHIAAWSEYFPSHAERYVWRMSSTYIASAGMFWVLMCVAGNQLTWASDYWVRFVQLRAWKIEYALLGFGATICGVSYILARFFLVVDAVVSLRQLPAGAYDTPDWTTIFPHL
ncbi:hypothetical protein MMC30_001482 [Trapelia coarctata]|nr:hypothetical protein [Trapelia coarctata]